MEMFRFEILSMDSFDQVQQYYTAMANALDLGSVWIVRIGGFVSLEQKDVEQLIN